MTSFLIALAVLIGGYFIYGTIVGRVFGIDGSRATPATARADGVDYVAMPTWKVFLIQFLNIAGLGPIFGAIMGVMFGPAAFLWIALGTIFAGGVHDFVSAMISMRDNGASLPEIIGRELGGGVKVLMRVFCIGVLLLVASVFVVSPSTLLAGMFGPGSIWANVTLWIGLIFAYYVIAAMLPIDKVIGKAYPVFGFALIFMALGILGVLLFGDVTIPDGFAGGLGNRRPDAEEVPLFPIMFVSIACGAISGFHGTQSPMMARCLKSEKLAQPVFYGAMVAEGIVALIWAAAAIAFTGGYPELSAYMSENTAGTLVKDISIGWLGTIGGILAIFGVVAAPITTGDTAMRSARLIAADIIRVDQKPVGKRLLVGVPLFVIAALLTYFASNPKQFEAVWRYFAWFNQTLACFTLWACTVYLRRKGKCYWIALLPALFMTVVSVSFPLVAPVSQGGFGLLTGARYCYGVGAGVLTAAVAAIVFFVRKPLTTSGSRNA